MVCFTNVSFSQIDSIKNLTYSKIYLGELFVGYKNCYFVLDSQDLTSNRYTFYLDFKSASIGRYPVAYPSQEYNFVTVTDSISGRCFKVSNILDEKSNEITVAQYGQKPIFKLVDIETSEIIYYKYDPEFSTKFLFLTTKPNIDKDILIKNIDKSYDEIENETTYHTPYNLDASITRISKNNANTYYLSLEYKSNNVNYGLKGVTVLFTDGTKWQRPNDKVDVDYRNGNFVYNCFIPLTKEDLKIFQTKIIKKYKLYIYEVNFTEGFIFNNYAKQIDKIK